MDELGRSAAGLRCRRLDHAWWSPAAKAFAADADISVMRLRLECLPQGPDLAQLGRHPPGAQTDHHAAVSGLLGGGCVGCVFAADNAQFSQPEIKLGIIPGAGSVGQKAFFGPGADRPHDGRGRDRATGLVSRNAAGRATCRTQRPPKAMCGYSLLALMATKRRSIAPSRSPLSEGLLFERRLFHALFSSAQPEGGRFPREARTGLHPPLNRRFEHGASGTAFGRTIEMINPSTIVAAFCPPESAIGLAGRVCRAVALSSCPVRFVLARSWRHLLPANAPMLLTAVRCRQAMLPAPQRGACMPRFGR